MRKLALAALPLTAALIFILYNPVRGWHQGERAGGEEVEGGGGQPKRLDIGLADHNDKEREVIRASGRRHELNHTHRHKRRKRHQLAHEDDRHGEQTERHNGHRSDNHLKRQRKQQPPSSVHMDAADDPQDGSSPLDRRRTRTRPKDDDENVSAPLTRAPLESGETNPLIESARSFQDDEVRGEQKKGKRVQKHDPDDDKPSSGHRDPDPATPATGEYSNQLGWANPKWRRNNYWARNIRPGLSLLSDLTHHEGQTTDGGRGDELPSDFHFRPSRASRVRADASKHRGDWCNMDCSINSNQGGPDRFKKIICGSDGQLYGSMCELRREACRNSVRLQRRSLLDCPIQAGGRRRRQQHIGGKYNNHDATKVRVVELNRKCNRGELESLKEALLSDFGDNIELMFKQFDSNNDSFIEAHELWPHVDLGDESRRIMYAQVWQNHSSKCPGTIEVDRFHRHRTPSSSHYGQPAHEENVDDDSEGDLNCWYFLDFVFEPHYPWNPCSLSHLMLFDLPHPGDKFDYQSFRRAFNNNNDAISSKHPTTRVSPYRNSTISSEAKGDDGDLNTSTHLVMALGESKLLDCFKVNSEAIDDAEIDRGEDENDDADANRSSFDELEKETDLSCLWSRLNVDLSTIRDPHVSIERGVARASGNSSLARKSSSAARLRLRDAQLYLSGQFKCVCESKNLGRKFARTFNVQVLGDTNLEQPIFATRKHTHTAKPRVTVKPKFQWSLPNSRILFECRYDYIDSSWPKQLPQNQAADNSPDGLGQVTGEGQFGLQIEWFKDANSIVIDSERFARFRDQSKSTNNGPNNNSNNNEPSSTLSGPSTSTQNVVVEDFFDHSPAAESMATAASGNYELTTELPVSTKKSPRVSSSSARASVTMASTRLALEGLKQEDTGQYTCRVRIPIKDDERPSDITRGRNLSQIYSEGQGTLLVQDQPQAFAGPSPGGGGTSAGEPMDDGHQDGTGTHLWIFHDNGIRVYKLQNDDGQEIELLREINGHSLVSAEVDGNWNQLTLCGGLNPEQVVICEWSDNALYIDVPYDFPPASFRTGQQGSNANGEGHAKVRKYIYVGQPNLNRVIVMDGLKFEIVAIINTEPQPRKLFPFKSNRIHLSKWVRRRLSPMANARWLSAIGQHAHPLEQPTSQLPTSRPPTAALDGGGQASQRRQQKRRQTTREEGPIWGQPVEHEPTAGVGGGATGGRGQARLMAPSKLIQHDIWLLCYGQPLVIDPSGDDRLEDPGKEANVFYPPVDTLAGKSGAGNSTNSSPKMGSSSRRRRSSFGNEAVFDSSTGSVHPFTPRLSHGRPLAWSMTWPGSVTGGLGRREARLRNRKSVQIIQSTFLPHFLRADSANVHRHDENEIHDKAPQVDDEENFRQQQQRRRRETISAAGEFKRLTVLTTHYLFASGATSGAGVVASARKGALQPPFHLKKSPQFDLIQDLIVPPRPYPLELDSGYKVHHAYVTHYDDQRLYRVSMDEHRYDSQIDLQDCDPINLISTAQGLVVVQCRDPIAHNLIGQLVLDELTSSRIEFNAKTRAQESYLSPDHRYLVSIYSDQTVAAPSGVRDAPHQQGKRSASGEQESRRRQSIIYVQLVSVQGLRLLYEIKTSLEISQCSFVWKDGYYAAIFVSINRRDQQSEVLSLRLADSRLELMVRVPGLISASRHKEALNVLPELQIAALSTSQGTYIVDLEENRVTQTLHSHQSLPTLLWV